MWVPSSAEELEAAVDAGDLVETGSLDFKREINNKAVAVDVAAMALDGGVLVYGVGEDANERPAEKRPFVLKRQKERIDSIVTSAVTEVPHIEIVLLPLKEDPAKGYLVVVVPQSARAPHMARGKYYGRGATGNRQLNEPDVARLYARRQTWEVDRASLIEETIAMAPSYKGGRCGCLHMLCKPVLETSDLVHSAFGAKALSEVRDLVKGVSTKKVHPSFLYPTFGEGTWETTADAWLLAFYTSNDSAPHFGETNRLLQLSVGFDGDVTLHVRPVAEQLSIYLVVESKLEEFSLRFMTLAGLLYERIGYRSSIDIVLAVTDLRDATSYLAQQLGRSMSRYSSDDYRSGLRASPSELAAAPRELATRLLDRLYRGLGGHIKPFDH